MIVLSDGNNQFSRSDIVLSIANKDGGAHVDLKVNGKYAELSRKNSMNVSHEQIDGEKVSVNNIELACLRQIAFELLKSLKVKLPG